MKLTTTLGGLAGAVALTLLNESARKVTVNAPRLDLLGENALAKLMKGGDLLPSTAKRFFPLAGDLMTNTFYYAMAKGSTRSNTVSRGALLGLAAGIGALVLPGKLGLPEQHTNRTTSTQAMTIAWYLVGGLVAAAVINLIDNDPVPSNRAVRSGAMNVAKKVINDQLQRAI